MQGAQRVEAAWARLLAGRRGEEVFGECWYKNVKKEINLLITIFIVKKIEK
jgi:hypothetical protein